MIKSRTPLKPRYDQNLVADQPGRRIFFTGLLMALVIGLAIRGLIAPQKIQEMVRSAASRIHQNVKVSFDSAYVSLSERGLPRLAVVIDKVEMDSSEDCWGRPLLKAQQIILPISLTSLLIDHQPFRKIQARQTDVIFRSKKTSCSVSTEVQQSALTENQVVTLAKPRSSAQIPVETVLDELEIDYLKLDYPEISPNPMEVVDFVMQVRSHQPKVVVLQAKTHIVKDSILQNYVSHGKIHLEYKEFPTRDLLVHFFGNWREGSYSLNAAYNFNEASFSSNVELKHIPAAQVISVLRDYGWLRGDFDGRKIWVTMKGQSQGTLKNWEKLPLVISDFKVEGDVGEILVPYFEASQLRPFTFKPMVARVKDLNLDRLLEFLKRPRELDFIGRLGDFSGDLYLPKENELRLSGRHSGLELVFSSRGTRQIQALSSVKGDLIMKDQGWNLNVKDIVLDRGKFKGALKLVADRDFREINLDIDAEELVLSPDIQKLITNGGEIPMARADLQAKIKGGLVQSLRGGVSSPKFKAHAIDFEKFNTRFQSEKGQVVVNFQAQDLHVAPTAEPYPVLKKILRQDSLNSQLKFRQLAGRLLINSDRQMSWKNITLATENKAISLVSDGEWNQQGLLRGQVNVRGPKNSIWYISGHRDQPQFTESNAVQSPGH